jgi:uncharacterized protein YjbI with pentapeptide repeats
MSDNNTDGQRTWLIVLPFIFILFVAGVFLAFVNVEGLTIEQRLEYGIKALTTTGTIFAGIAVFINAFYAAKRAEAMEKSALAANESAKAALKNAEAALKNAVIAEDKQITERFAKAIEQLGSEKIEVRLGAIYTLERIAKDSPKDHWTIMEILTAFVRENAPKKPEEKKTEDTQQILKIRTDIQAALTVIGRRNYKDDRENEILNLNNTNLTGANLNKANLQNANLREVNLQQANLAQANLYYANLAQANLQQADLAQANLYYANLVQANLQQADLTQANLYYANLSVENILVDDFGANLTEASLYQTNLQNAFLYYANLQKAKLEETNLRFAALNWTKLQGANLKKAKNLEQQQIDSAKGDRTTILPDYLEYPKHWE